MRESSSVIKNIRFCFLELNCIVLRSVLYCVIEKKKNEKKIKIFVKQLLFIVLSFYFLTTTITAISKTTTTLLLLPHITSIFDIIDGQQSGTRQNVCLTQDCKDLLKGNSISKVRKPVATSIPTFDRTLIDLL